MRHNHTIRFNTQASSMQLNSLFFSTEIREEELEVVTPIVEDLGKLSVLSI